MQNYRLKQGYSGSTNYLYLNIEQEVTRKWGTAIVKDYQMPADEQGLALNFQ